MKRSPLKRRTAIKRRRTGRRRRIGLTCNWKGCKRIPRWEGLCRAHGRAHADHLFSRWIRSRDRVCVGCGVGEPLDCMHGVTRGKDQTRWDPENAWAGCRRCHVWWTNHDNAWRAWMRTRMGQPAYDALILRSNLGAVPDVGDVIREYRSRLEEAA